MSAPDFEISAVLRARRLTVHIPPEAETETDGKDVTLTFEQMRSGLPAKLETGVRYTDVGLKKSLIGENTPSVWRAPGQAEAR